MAIKKTSLSILRRAISAPALRRLAEQYEDVSRIAAAWRRGDYGVLRDAETGEEIGPATRKQAIASFEAGYEGFFEVVLTAENGPERGTVSAWVEPTI